MSLRDIVLPIATDKRRVGTRSAAPRTPGSKDSVVAVRPGGEGWTIRDHRAILHSEPYASADLGAASDVTAKSVQSEAASASSPTPISLQLTSDVIAGMRGARLLWQAASAQGETTTRPRRTRWDDSALVRFDRHSQFTRAVRQITGATRQGWSRRKGVCDDFMRLCCKIRAEW